MDASNTSPGRTGGVSEALVQPTKSTQNQGHGSGQLLKRGLADFREKIANVASLLKELDRLQKANAALATELSNSKRTISCMAENEERLARENSWLTAELSKRDHMPSGFDNAVGPSPFTGNLGSMEFYPPGTGDPFGGGERWQWNYDDGEDSVSPTDLVQQGHFNMQYDTDLGVDSMSPTDFVQQGHFSTQYESNISADSMNPTDPTPQGHFNTQYDSTISADNQAGSFINFQLQLPTPSPHQPPANPYAPNLTFSESFPTNTSYTGPVVASTPAPASVNEFMLFPPSGSNRSSDPNGIPDGHYRGTVCLDCHQNWWNTWCDATPQGCHNCQALGRTCRRPRCENFDGGCGDKACKWAHRSDGFGTTVVKPKTLKRKSKKTDRHENPPKRLAVERGGGGSV